jgi:hypothetical protein
MGNPLKINELIAQLPGVYFQPDRLFTNLQM